MLAPFESVYFSLTLQANLVIHIHLSEQRYYRIKARGISKQLSTDINWLGRHVQIKIRQATNVTKFSLHSHFEFLCT